MQSKDAREQMGNINHKLLKDTDNYVVATLAFTPGKVRIECYTPVKDGEGRGCAISHVAQHEKTPILRAFESAGYLVFDRTEQDRQRLENKTQQTA